jgi:hypothetical protein
VAGPGRVWLMPWQSVLARFSIAPQGQMLRFEMVRTAEENADECDHSGALPGRPSPI